VARAGAAGLPSRRDDLGLVEVDVPPGAVSVELEHRPGVAEWTGAALSLLSLAALGLASVGRARS
jgi:hypothetical protein